MSGWFQKFWLVFFFLGVVSCLGLVGCSLAPLDQGPQILGKEIILRANHGSAEFVIEIADTPQKRAQGLMDRKYLPENHGMLFIFEKPDRHMFWMKNTWLSLDIIFFDDDFRVVGIIENTTPMSLAPLQIDAPARFVLEVSAGTVKKHGINSHTTARLLGTL